MRRKVSDHGVLLWLSAHDTEMWADRPGCSWPCSQLRGKRVFAAFDRNGLVDLTINGKDGDCDATELSAITSDFLAGHIHPDHPCWFVCVGQFQEGCKYE